MKNILKTLALMGIVFGFGEKAQASQTATFTVQATIKGTCTAIAVPDVDFTFYDSTAAAAVKTTNVSVTCSNGTPYNVGLNKGANGADVNNRKMKASSGADTLNYSITKPGNTNWGDTGADRVSGTGNGLAQPIVATLTLPAGQNGKAPDIYKDTITATVTY